jgi:uncharacterized protein involved in type VI secretion and phage assembly
MSIPGHARGEYAVERHWLAGVHIATVVSVKDPQSQGRVQVKLPAIDPTGAAPVWARVSVPYAGDHYGAFLLPDVGTEVLVAFTAGDATWPVVIGNLWNGATGIPETLSSDAVDRWAFTGKNGTRIAIVEEASGQEKVEIQLPSGAVTATLTDASGGTITIEAAGNTIKIAPAGVSIQSPAKVEVQASQVTVTAGMVQVDAGMAKFSGVVQCATLITNAVVSSSYTPGAGNVW